MSKKNIPYDYMIKVIIIGDSAVGKTNILLRYTQQTYKNCHISTIGVDFKIKTISVGDTKIKMQIWDTAGQDKFRTITQTYFKGAEAAILVYSVTSRLSFTNIENWLKQLDNKASQNIVKILVANKCDLSSQREVSTAQGEALSRKYRINFLECSAKEDINIKQIFHQVGTDIDSKLTNSSFKHINLPGNNIVVNNNSHTHPSNCKC